MTRTAQGRHRGGLLLLGAALLTTTAGCELVAGIDDREVFAGATGGQGGTTSSSGGGQGGQGGGAGGTGGLGGDGGTGGDCGTAVGAWPDSTVYCLDGGGCVEGEDGAVVTVLPDYEHCPDMDVVHDLVTDLYWQRAADCQGCSHAEAEDHCNQLSTYQAGGFTDWRVPTLRELVSIIDYGLDQPVASTYFSPETSFFVSDDLKENNARWGVRLSNGQITWWSQGLASNARCVRGSAPASSFQVNTNDDTVVDTGLALEWTRSAFTSGPFSWNQARIHCNTLSVPPGGGWRLPSAKEHLTIYLPNDAGGAFPSGFAQAPQTYWTATPEPGSSTRAMAIDYAPSNFAEGALHPELIGLTHGAICVRQAP